MKRKATAQWQGTGKDGKGNLSTPSEVLNKISYSYATRFEENHKGTNPEELIAAAHAGCFSMKMAFLLEAEGYPAENLESRCEIEFVNGAVTESHLYLRAKVPGIKKELFNSLVADAGENCPISKLLNTTLKVDAELV